MMKFEFDQRKGEEVLLDIEGMGEQLDQVMRHGWYGLMRAIRDEARKEILRRPKGGRTYIIRTKSGKRHRRHVASAPFETHANITGKTRKSIGFKVHGTERAEFGYGASGRSQTTEWGEYLEFGTRNMAPRPSLANAIDKVLKTDETSYFDVEFSRRFERANSGGRR